MTTLLKDIFNSSKLPFRLLIDSLSKVEFYKEVYKNFSGYGFRYLFTLVYLSTVLVTFIFIDRIEYLRVYLENKIVTNGATALVDTVLKNWESFNYDGSIINTPASNEPIMIKGLNNKVLVAIDPNDEVVGSLKKKVPIVFGKSKLIIGLSELSDNYQFTFNYNDIFGTSSSIIDAEYIAKLLKNYLEYFNKTIIYVFLPLMVLFNFTALILEKILIVVIVYFALKTFVEEKATLKSAIRIVAFSCGLSALMFPFGVISNNFGLIANATQLWTSFLIISAITSMRKGRVM